MSNIASAFAMALLDLARETGSQKDWQDQLEEISAVVSEDPDYLLALKSPGITREQKKEWLSELFHGRIDPTLEDMLQVSVSHNAAGELPEIAKAYRELYEAEQGIVPVTVTSAIDLSDKQSKRLKLKLEEQLKAPVKLSLIVDPSLMGGLVIKTPDRLMDNSIKGRLETMKEQLLRD